MVYFERIIDMELPKGQSAFLWGARKTGKSTYLNKQFSDSILYDFLQTDLTFELIKRPWKLREMLAAENAAKLNRPIILDEVQKVPQVLNEVHWLIENRNLSFILCGSSARKLKRGNANLLGGRAWRYELYPLTSKEVENPSLLRVLNRGMLPAHYLQEKHEKSIKAYVGDYLKEEVFAEGLTRNVPAFSRFFEAMAYSHGEMINYSNIARDCGVDSKTVKEYFLILTDTLLGRLVSPFKRRQSRREILKTPKFYLFDVGIAGGIIKREIKEERGEQFGKALEHFIFMELQAYDSYRETDFDINYWRTKTGLEVDFILGRGHTAIEVKGSDNIKNRDLHPMKAFIEEYSPKNAIVVCNEKRARIQKGIRILPWRMFLEELWEGKIIG